MDAKSVSASAKTQSDAAYAALRDAIMSCRLDAGHHQLPDAGVRCSQRQNPNSKTVTSRRRHSPDNWNGCWPIRGRLTAPPAERGRQARDLLAQAKEAFRTEHDTGVWTAARRWRRDLPSCPRRWRRGGLLAAKIKNDPERLASACTKLERHPWQYVCGTGRQPVTPGAGPAGAGLIWACPWRNRLSASSTYVLPRVSLDFAHADANRWGSFLSSRPAAPPPPPRALGKSRRQRLAAVRHSRHVPAETPPLPGLAGRGFAAALRGRRGQLLPYRPAAVQLSGEWHAST